MSDEDDAQKIVFDLAEKLEARFHAALREVLAEAQSAQIAQSAAAGAISQVMCRVWVVTIMQSVKGCSRRFVQEQVAAAILEAPWETAAGAMYDAVKRGEVAS